MLESACLEFPIRGSLYSFKCYNGLIYFPCYIQHYMPICLLSFKANYMVRGIQLLGRKGFRKHVKKYVIAHLPLSSYSHPRGGPGSIPLQSMWDLWWTKWHWHRSFPEYFGFPLSISFHRCSITRKRTKNNHHRRHLHHTVAQEASRLRCISSVCCGALHHYSDPQM
jgi:hypothetical protein